MRPLLCLLLLAAPAFAQSAEEDAAHRADRLETERLNTAALRRRGAATAAPSAQDSRAYQRALDDYDARLAAWRRQVAACQSGDYNACE